MDSRPRLLLLGPVPPGGWADSAEAVPVADTAAAAAHLRAGGFDAVVTSSTDFAFLLYQRERDQAVLANLDDGVAAVAPDGLVKWANAALWAWCGGDPVGRPLIEVLGLANIADPLAAARNSSPLTLRVYRPNSPTPALADLTIRAVADPAGGPDRFVAVVRNVTPEVEQQRKLDALHQAGRDLAGLDPSLLAEMNVPTRVELLKQNLRKSIHDLLHYDIIELRLLDRSTGELRPLLEDGMLPTAASRVLYARPTGNGVTGYVAASGKSYLCPDTASDPLYLEGATGARSSMTVPLKYNDEVIGTLNVESPRPNGFGVDDLQFTELFSKEIAAALHTLDLLSAQQMCTAAQSIEAVNREIALPVDDVLSTAAVLLAKIGGRDPEAAEALKHILASARLVKENVARVGHDLASVPGGGSGPLGGRRVLIVDPDERTRRQAHLLLERLGAGVETAATATDGLALLADTGYDAVFLDVKPPDMGGYEAYRRLRDARPGTRVALTTGFGYDVAHSIVKARQDGMQHLLFKPFRQDQVVKAVLDGKGSPTGPSSEYGPS